jgi:hypothetical protein
MVGKTRTTSRGVLLWQTLQSPLHSTMMKSQNGCVLALLHFAV